MSCIFNIPLPSTLILWYSNWLRASQRETRVREFSLEMQWRFFPSFLATTLWNSPIFFLVINKSASVRYYINFFSCHRWRGAASQLFLEGISSKRSKQRFRFLDRLFYEVPFVSTHILQLWTSMFELFSGDPTIQQLWFVLTNGFGSQNPSTTLNIPMAKNSVVSGIDWDSFATLDNADEKEFV